MAKTTLDGFAKEMQAAGRKATREMNAGLRHSADNVKNTARGIASTESSRIAETIKVRTNGKYGVRITAGGLNQATAVLFELGNVRAFGRRREGDSFRHPVFADPDKARSAQSRNILRGRKEIKTEDAWTWVSQPRKPYLAPAAELHKTQMLADMHTAVDAMFKK